MRSLLQLAVAPLLLAVVPADDTEAVHPVELAKRPLPVGPVLLDDPASPEVVAQRRVRLAEAVGDGVVLLSAGEDPDNGRFYPEWDFWWLTGARAPGAVLALVCEGGAVAEERLYLPPPNPMGALWNGPVLNPGDAATARTGVADTRSLREFRREVADLVEGRAVYGGGPTIEALAEAGELELNQGYRAGGNFGAGGFRAETIRRLQAVKDPGEQAALRAAVDVTQAALVEALLVGVPGAWEFEVEAAIEGGFRKRGAQTWGFPSICGSGPNSCVLHYRENERRIEDGDVLLMDVGARFHGYTADVTRTIPANGKFTARQRELYQAVWDAQQAAVAVLRPGASQRDVHAAAVAVLEERGLREHFPHSTGHGLGLRVHDTPKSRDPLEPGMVVTVEPGVYLADEGIGIRIEDDYLITEDGAEWLSDAVPTQVDELEAFLARVRERFGD